MEKHEINGIKFTTDIDEYQEGVWQYYAHEDGEDGTIGWGHTEDEAIENLFENIYLRYKLEA